MTKWKKPTYEDLEVFRKRLNLTDMDIITYQTYYEAAQEKIKKYQTDKHFILPPGYLARNTINIETVEQFKERLKLYSSVFSKDFITKQNKLASLKMEQFIKHMGLDDKTENELINEWRSLKWWQKRDLFIRNEEIPVFLYASSSDEDIQDSPFDFTAEKIKGYLNYAKKK